MVIADVDAQGKVDEYRALVIMKKEGQLRLKIELKGYLGGNLWKWVDESCVKEVLNEPKVPADKLFE